VKLLTSPGLGAALPVSRLTRETRRSYGASDRLTRCAEMRAVTASILALWRPRTFGVKIIEPVRVTRVKGVEVDLS
jgi:hypothetical protein